MPQSDRPVFGAPIDRSQETYEPSPYPPRRVLPSGDVSPDGRRPWPRSSLTTKVIVLGGMGTIAGVILGAVILKLMPEKLRFFNEYRLLLFGLLLVLMMRFRPEGLVANRRRQLEFHEDDEELADEIGEWKHVKEEA